MACSICLGSFIGKDKSVIIEKQNVPGSIVNIQQNKQLNINPVQAQNINSLNSENPNRQGEQGQPQINSLEIDTDLRVLPYSANIHSTKTKCRLSNLIVKLRNLQKSCTESLERCKKKCNREITSDASFMYTPCNHLFHSDCLKAWMEIKNTCPECRRNLPIEQSNLPNNREESISI